MIRQNQNWFQSNRKLSGADITGGKKNPTFLHIYALLKIFCGCKEIGWQYNFWVHYLTADQASSTENKTSKDKNLQFLVGELSSKTIFESCSEQTE